MSANGRWIGWCTSASDSLTFHIKPNDSLNYDTYTVANFGNGLIVEIPELFTAGTYNYVIEDLHHLFEYLNIRNDYQEIVLLGHSMGAHHGVRYELKYPIFIFVFF